MKKSALSLLIPALLLSTAAHSAEVYNKDGNKLDLYGKVDALHYFSDDSNKDGDQTYVRFGFKGETQINDIMTGYGQWEYNVMANNTESGGGNNNYTRLGFAGLGLGQYGSFDYGRNYGVLYDVEAWTDVLPEFGGDSYTTADNFMTGRANGVATYRNSGFFGLVDGLNVAVQYQGANDGDNSEEFQGTNNGRDARSQNGDGWGLSTTYEIGGGVSAGAAYSSSDRTNEQQSSGDKGTNNNAEKADAWTAGLKYDANNVYLATMYSETRNMTAYGENDDSNGVANKTQNIEATAQYQFDFGLRPEISYLQSKGKDLNATKDSSVSGDKDLVKYLSLGTTYFFNKNMSTYVDYKINLLDGDDSFYKDNGISTDNIVALGMVYQF
ncbi:porin OmpC [Rahnella sikkimica]|uniref:Porin n=1 Tax=Rahnella sikkimica TaxID=1805933 RepID=A0A2L1UQW7_9GAMM|nr:porin OmpC [Rahnella sikkimica]AVF35324.1 porin [Rahnella sikkimica]